MSLKKQVYSLQVLLNPTLHLDAYLLAMAEIALTNSVGLSAVSNANLNPDFGSPDCRSCMGYCNAVYRGCP